MDDELEEALSFFKSPRGQWVIGQALYIAIKEMQKVPDPYKEYSNIEDMKYLMTKLFPTYNLTKGDL